MIKFQEFDEFDKMWMSYLMFKREAMIARSGYAYVNIYPEPTEEDFLNRFESDLEHSAGVAHIVSEMALWFPELFSYLKLEPRTAERLARVHDIVEIYTGDIADDGRPEHAQKDEKELITFLEWLYTQPEEIQEAFFRLFLEFQTRSTPRGQFLCAADKLEAILQLLNYERMGQYGDVRLKEEPSKRDLEFAAKIGTYNATDVWAYHYKTIVVDCFATEVTLPFTCLLDSAVRDVRGEWFPWWTFWQNKHYPLDLRKPPAA
ncbi:HD domain-containing protein [Candidatus Saccharibacteria bacterium]|nr:HD domain-containing protein [Candidatus Saccharibacteria bacterium]